ncbi:phytanoyl-CoA dioxygenase family protein [soil metagenome]
MAALNTVVPETARETFEARGFSVAKGLFSLEETTYLKKYFTDMVERGGDGWAEGGVHPDHDDPLKRYPRLLQPHRGDNVAKNYMVDDRIRVWLGTILGKEPLAVQTMVYFKPPGARGQALHQDNRFLRVDPGTCIAAWMALDRCDEENGCLEVVPGSHTMEMICLTPADASQSFTGEMVQIPPGMHTENVIMDPGDVIFFNGSLIHGSPPNLSDRFRAIIVGHYIDGGAKEVAEYYFPVYRMDGTTVDDLEVAESGQACGTYIERDGALEYEVTGMTGRPRAAH